MENEILKNKPEDPEFQHTLIKAILEASLDGVLVVNKQGIIVCYNQRFIEVWELSIHHPMAQNIAIGTSDEPILTTVTSRVSNPQAFLERVKMLYDNPELSDLCELELKDGRTLERHSRGLWSDNHQYMGRVWFFRDITTQKKIENELVKLIRRDPLTDIPNRRYFLERSVQEFVRARRHLTYLCVASLDIDHLKEINVHYGHAAGDEMLQSLCRQIQQQLRDTDFFARIGGEEFAILMPDVELEGAMLLCERIRQAIAQHKLFFNGQETGCTVSIGVTILKATDTAIEDCLFRADKAMYQAKKNGRNLVESAE
ncbi:sensor domain-containing diguanylate cyclase [Legionella maioricensis]|uniref:diguanylate cyclase n=1 Tax=Legionella maioricensis TaxID=2896528 RepID=A0A9X2IAQ4_9GAMM|nr:GGDEF domain-containing protein [Legionella maioricensis]MCL9682732.1 GGDEF domain-containing protein [Legionella maioricensis]MCL9687220.1 GGDEF domain-containing protein [Legionella maioricensis]